VSVCAALLCWPPPSPPCPVLLQAAVGSPPDVASQLRVMCNGPQNILAELQQLWAAEEY